jgi:hypothetical protein
MFLNLHSPEAEIWLVLLCTVQCKPTSESEALGTKEIEEDVSNIGNMLVGVGSQQAGSESNDDNHI